MTQAQADAEQWRGTDQGTQLKATSGWANNGNGMNTSGFSALPGGFRYFDGYFYFITIYGLWWSSTDDITILAWTRALTYSHGGVNRTNDGKASGYSVRCVRDN